VGYSWTRKISICYKKLLPWSCWCIISLRRYKVRRPKNCTDIFSRESFLALQTWLADCRALASPDIVIILVGNKSDISTPQNNLNSDIRSFANDYRGGEVAGGFHREREVSVEEAGRWASREGTCPAQLV
jgi:GTPase SAR1 family protein